MQGGDPEWRIVMLCMQQSMLSHVWLPFRRRYCLCMKRLLHRGIRSAKRLLQIVDFGQHKVHLLLQCCNSHLQSVRNVCVDVQVTLLMHMLPIWHPILRSDTGPRQERNTIDDGLQLHPLKCVRQAYAARVLCSAHSFLCRSIQLCAHALDLERLRCDLLLQFLSFGAHAHIVIALASLIVLLCKLLTHLHTPAALTNLFESL
jgi:hypothetical protein